MVRYFIAASFMFCSVQLLFGFQGTSNSVQQINVEGAVVNAQTGRPIPYALVEVWASPTRTVLTDADGNFAFRGLPPGTLAFNARKPGYFTSGANPYFGNIFTSIILGPETGKIELKLNQESVVTGQVTDSEDNPLEGAYVELHKVELVEGRRRLSQTGGKATDEDGNFRFGNLQAGRYYAVVKPGTQERQNLKGDARKNTAFPLIVYFPSSPDLAGATPIDLLPGQRERITFTLKRKPAFRLSGVLSGMAAYKSVNPPSLVDDWGQSLISAHNWDQETGKFEFPPIPAGQYAFAVSGNNGNHSAMQRELVTVDKDTPNFSMGLAPDLKIAVNVRYDRGPDVKAGQCVGAIPAANGEQIDCSTVRAMVSLIPVELANQQIASLPESKEDPSLVINGVMPGKYIVRAMPWGGGHVHSLRCGSVDLLREPLVITQGSQVSPIELVLRDEAGSLTVHVQSDKSEAHVKVLLMSQVAPLLPPFVVEVDPTREQSWGGLEPGDYKVYAFDSMDGIEYGNPEAMEKYAAKAASVTVTANSSSNVTVNVIRRGE